VLRLVLARDVVELRTETTEERADDGLEFPGRGGGGGKRREEPPVTPLYRLGLDDGECAGDGVGRGLGRSGSFGGIGVVGINVLS
jgi:hypothetical protein